MAATGSINHTAVIDFNLFYTNYFDSDVFPILEDLQYIQPQVLTP